MKELILLPADSYTVVNKTVINHEDKDIISMLYQPIIGHTAVSLYLTLINDLDKRKVKSEEYSHHHLMMTMQMPLDKIISAREKLEAVGLIKTYYKTDSINHYVYLLFSPIGASEFFQHPILNVVLYNNIGKNEYERLLDYYRVPRFSFKDYNEITKSFSDVFNSIPGKSEFKSIDILAKTTSNLNIKEIIDFDLLQSSIPKSMYSDRCFTNDVKELINSLATIYNIDDYTMQGLVRDSLNEKGLIDRTYLRKSARSYYQYQNDGSLPTIIYRKQPEYLKKPVGDNSKWAKMVYTFENITPYDFLKAQYKGGQPTARDLKIIEELLVDQQLNPGVVNVLISYVLKVSNQKLNKKYVETIAGQWKRLNIETVEEAMRTTEKQHRKMKKIMETGKKKTVSVKTTKEEKLPAWFDKELEKVDITEEEQNELDKLLENIV